MRALVLTLALFLWGCSASTDPSVIPIRVGDGPAFRPPSTWSAPRGGQAVGSLRCGRRAGTRFGVHLELFARGRVVIVPAGIGVAPPRRRDGAYVVGGRCHYPILTREPTGVLEIAPGAGVTLDDFFALWGQPLTRNRLAGFSGAVRVHVDGRPWIGDPADVALRRHAQIVLQVGPEIAPHRTYTFPAGL